VKIISDIQSLPSYVQHRLFPQKTIELL